MGEDQRETRTATKRPRLVGVPVELLAQPRSGDTMTDRWWAVQDGLAIFYQAPGSKGWTPQCNADRRVTEHLVGRPTLYPDAEAQHIPVAFLGPWDYEYGHRLTPDLFDAAVDVSGRTGQPNAS